MWAWIGEEIGEEGEERSEEEEGKKTLIVVDPVRFLSLVIQAFGRNEIKDMVFSSIVF